MFQFQVFIILFFKLNPSCPGGGARSRHGGHSMDSGIDGVGSVHDHSGTGFVLWWFGEDKKCPFGLDAMPHFDGLTFLGLGRLWI